MAGEQEVIKNISNIFERRRAAVYALALRWAANTINYFRSHQAGNTFWENRTTTAMRLMFTKAFIDGDQVGFLMAHMVEYGVYLELANNGKNEAIRPTMSRYSRLFLDAVKKLYEE